MEAPIPTEELRELTRDATPGCEGGDPWGQCKACKAEYRLKGFAIRLANEVMIQRDSRGKDTP